MLFSDIFQHVFLLARSISFSTKKNEKIITGKNEIPAIKTKITSCHTAVFEIQPSS